MNWLSQVEIKRRAAISDEEALNVSIKHWEQICEAVEEKESISGHYGDGSCGLCQRKNHLKKSCSSCFLWDNSDDGSCGQEWRAFGENRSLPNAQAMLNRLYMERGKMYGGKDVKKECKKEEPKLRHGDYGYCRNGEARLAVKKYDNDFCYGGVDHLWDSLSEKGTSGRLTDPNAVILGNIFDDLKRNAEDLEEFGANCCLEGCNGRISVCSGSCGINITIKTNDKKSSTILLNAGSENTFHQKLGQVIATAKRKAKKDC